LHPGTVITNHSVPNVSLLCIILKYEVNMMKRLAFLLLNDTFNMDFFFYLETIATAWDDFLFQELLCSLDVGWMMHIVPSFSRLDAADAFQLLLPK